MSHAIIDHWQVKMRIGIGISMTRKVLSAGQNAIVLHTFHVHVAFSGHIVTVFAKRAIIDHWVGGVVVDVNIGSKVDRNAYSTALARNFLPHSVDQIIVLDRPKH